MVSKQLLSKIRCPCSYEDLQLASRDLIECLNHEQQSGRLFNRLGIQVEDEISNGLVNSSATYFIMVRHGIPELSPDHVIPIDHLELVEPN